MTCAFSPAVGIRPMGRLPWQAEIKDGQVWPTQFLVSAIGALHLQVFLTFPALMVSPTQVFSHLEGVTT